MNEMQKGDVESILYFNAIKYVQVCPIKAETRNWNVDNATRMSLQVPRPL